MNCVKCMFKCLSGASSPGYMQQLTLENGMQAKFTLAPIVDNNCSKLGYNNGFVQDGKMKVAAHVCSSCGYVEFQRSY